MISTRREGDVFVLQLDEGENRFNRASVDAIHAGLDEAEAGAWPAALVVTGTGKFFSNGLDLDWMGTDEGRADGSFIGDVHRILGRILGLPMITVAAINGHAFAAGAMLATAHDLRIMRDDRGYWCLPEVDLQMPFTPGLLALFEARLPAAAAHRAIVTGRRYPAAEAAAEGLVDEAVPEAEVLPRALELAAELAGKAGENLGVLKRGLHGAAIDVLLG